MISEYTWPNYEGNDKAGCRVIVDEQGYSQDVQYGKTKLFIKSPQTVFGLEEARSKLIPGIIIFLQKVLALFLSFFLSKCYSKDESSWLKYYNYKHYYLNLWKLKYQIKTPS